MEGLRVAEDARAHPRAHARVRVEYHFGNTMGVGYTNDISEGGLFLQAEDIAPPGSRIYMRLILPGSTPREALKVIGMVKRTRQSGSAGMGIHFEVAYAQTRVILHDFMLNLLEHDSAHGPVSPLVIEEAQGSATLQDEGMDWSRTSAMLIRVLLAAVVVAIGAFFMVWLADKMGVR